MENKNTKVLIVDDDDFLINMYSLKFKNEGFEVVNSKSGRDAVDKLKTGLKPDIILLDLIMPDIDGFGVLDSIKKDDLLGDGTVIIMLTNQGSSDDIEKAKELGVDGYIVKATSIPSEVVKKVLEIFNNKK